MVVFLTILGLIVLCLVLLKIKYSGLPTSPSSEKHLDPLPYRRNQYFLTTTEREFFAVLYPIVHEMGYHLFTKVRLEDLLWLPPKTQNDWKWRGFVRSRHVDFVLCDRTNINPVLAIELDGSSHLREDRIKRDEFYRNLFNTIRLPFLQVAVRKDYNEIELKQLIEGVLKTR